MQTFKAFAKALNSMQGAGLDSRSAALQVIELAEQMPAPSALGHPAVDRQPEERCSHDWPEHPAREFERDVRQQDEAQALGAGRFASSTSWPWS